MKPKLLIRALRGEAVERPPIWMMRQAGRYLPEYHATKEQAGGFLGLCRIPEHGIEVTRQPIRRFGFDAAILFSDILIPAAAMGVDLDFAPGPVVANPVARLRDVEALRIPDPDTELAYVMDILRGLRQTLPKETALIGFAGAPFTVASYMVAATSNKGQFDVMRRMVYRAPEVLEALIDKVTETTLAYLDAQVNAGAEVIQLFDSSAWLLSPRHFQRFAIEPSRRIIAHIKQTGVPTIYFAPGAMPHLQWMPRTGADAVGLDWRVDLARARAVLGDAVAVQGNLDPACLLGSPESVRREAARILDQNGGRPGHVFNLGHGVLPDTPIENVEALVSAVKGEG